VCGGAGGVGELTLTFNKEHSIMSLIYNKTIVCVVKTASAIVFAAKDSAGTGSRAYSILTTPRATTLDALETTASYTTGLWILTCRLKADGVTMKRWGYHW
jgi:hypothetical protein